MSGQKLYSYLAQIFRLVSDLHRVVTLQSAKVLGLASLLALLVARDGAAQSVARVEVSATVVNAAPSQRAFASMRWLLRRRGAARRENGLASIVVNREQRRVSINYLKN